MDPHESCDPGCRAVVAREGSPGLARLPHSQPVSTGSHLGLRPPATDMGYACPVCESPQADAGHLANHLAFTALLRGGDHETWLDEHVPEWESLREPALGERVTDHASEVAYPQVFEDTTDREPTGAAGTDRGGHDHGHGEGGHRPPDPGPGRAPDSMASLLEGVDFSALRADENVDDEDLDEIIEHARELTSRRREDSETE